MKIIRKLGWILLGLGIYTGLLLLLTAVESGNPDASISSFSDALWYSIVTLSTVGYGDLYPITVIGKMIGVLFVMLSVGALAFLIGSAVSLLTGQMLPRLKLRLLRRKQWYVFSQMNDTSLALAGALQGQDRIVLFPMSDRGNAPKDANLYYYPGTIASAAAGKKDGCALFFLDEESGSNYDRAVAAVPLGHAIYCRTEQTLDRCPDNLTLFNRYTCCARDYWKRMPLSSREEELIFIGDGRYAWELLEQGLLVNILAPEQTVRYHVFGNWEDYLRCHPHLGLTVSVNEGKAGFDILHFHRESWNEDSGLLARASRVILCDDDDRENMAILRKLRRYFSVSGSVHLRSKASVPGETVFGTDDQIFTPENVMASGLTKTAQAMHEIYCASAKMPVPGWKELNEFTRQSNLAAADHLPVKVRLLLQDENITDPTPEQMKAACQRFLEDPRRDHYRRIEHLRWMRFHSMLGWCYAPIRDNAARRHPLLVPYDNLSEAEQAKDDYAWLLLASMAEKLEKTMEDT